MTCLTLSRSILHRLILAGRSFTLKLTQILLGLTMSRM